MSAAFLELVEMARRRESAFGRITRRECVESARQFTAEQRAHILERHRAGETGGNVLRMLSESADTLIRGIFSFSLYTAPHRRALLSRISLCALGGYGRSELSPGSDLDVCLLYEGALDDQIMALNDYLVPFLWDIGFSIGYSIRTVREAAELAATDIKVFTSYLEARLLGGDNMTFARLKLLLQDIMTQDNVLNFNRTKLYDRGEGLAEQYADLYAPEPNLKESAGGLRDLHTALWLFMVSHGRVSLEDVAGLGLISEDERLECVDAANFIWRVRNELHFNSGREEDELTFANQKHCAVALGYGTGEAHHISRFMRDYYVAARKLRQVLEVAFQSCARETGVALGQTPAPTTSKIIVMEGQLYAGLGDENWFHENPARIMEVFWGCARHRAELSRSTAQRITASLNLITDTFRTSNIVRHFFMAICSRPMEAGFALRQMANVGVLAKYIPEFGDIQGIIRYADFHHFPVDEHTLRAVEALAALRDAPGPVAGCLHNALEHMSDPYILVLAILCHDLGKSEGEEHVESGVRLTELVCRRIGMTEEDTELIAFLVQHHMTMTHISQYRDLDDLDMVREFAKTVRTENRLRALFLLSYADLAAVGPNVWNDWKGALLMKLYLRTEMILLGRTEAEEDDFWKSEKVEEVRRLVPASLADKVEDHVRGLGYRYLVAFTPRHIAMHLECVEQAREKGLAVHCTVHEETGMSEVTISTQDRIGLFSLLAGGFASQLVDINGAALFTRPDGFVVDCFVVCDATQPRPLTDRQAASIEAVLRSVILEGKDIQEYVDESRRRLFALLQPRIPVPTHIAFDNMSSRSHTVVDIETGDRTGLLYDITRAMAGLGLDIANARITTDARRVRDAFYVSLGMMKIVDEEIQTAIRERLHEAIHLQPVAETKGGKS